MATEEASVGQVEAKANRKIAGTIVAGHGFQHMYADGFLTILPFIYDSFGLSPLSAGTFSAVRQAASGLMTMGGGFVVDMFSGKRGLLLSGSLFLMGFGYLLMGLAPNYFVLLITVALAAAAGSFWHPVGLGILSNYYPKRRAFMMAIHRSAGNIGETVTPLLITAAMFAFTWRQVLLGGFLLIAAVSVTLFFTLSRLGLQNQATGKRGAGSQIKSIGGLFKDRTLPMLLLVSGLRGMADRGFIFFLPLFITRALEISEPGVSNVRIAWVVGMHLTIMAVMSIWVPPLIALVADRTGRKPVMLAVLTVATIFMGGLWWVGHLGWQFTILIAVFGAFRYAVANLTQAVSLDIAEGKRLEGSMIGLLWGNNALWGALSPVILGALIGAFATTENEFQMIFGYGFVLTLCATVAAIFLPNTGRPDREIPAQPTVS